MIRRDAAKILGCQEHVFSRLVDEGIFVPMQITRRSTAELDYLMFDRFSRAELLAFRQKLEDAVTVEVSSDMVSLSNVAKIQGEKQGTILDLVLRGKLKSVAMKKDGHLASRLMLNKSEVDAALWRPHGLSSEETAERLGIKRDTLRSLIDLKQFNPGKFGQHQRQLFDEEEVEAFRRRYVTLGMLTKESGIPKGELLVRFRRSRASPAFPVEQVNVMLIPRDIADRMVVGRL
ncbi:helix-turn-helix domain-containing protein [Neorhizobium tomejilense]|uniref:helix-turn-helix domain-containing protein n=1 Tax=Neorhizobium tomejilense TaxID=2093828 RepID=UPI003ECE9E52